MSQQPGPSDETTLEPDDNAETRLSTGSEGGYDTVGGRRAASGSTSSSHSGWLSSSQSDPGRFASGTILADRYRIVGLAGRGGMGEVYRADDLRLGQPVALKFLPEAVAKDATRLAQFHNEVRTARQISHRNVCRVYDIGEDQNRIFLTMEYVDGEDLASLLKRIGRFPQDKAIEIARQMCAGLAAAHELGVLHRDLKPANVMLDAEGRVRITDFGLAGVAAEIKDIRAGTPAYMAPEQLAGREVSIRSDIYALGLVFYEIFTGKRAFDAKNVAELLRMHDQPIELTPTTAVRDLDPAVERVILRCLERDPQRRPASALAVAAALPGGDPLAAALAAGETPSPEMVANAGARDAINPALGLAVVAAVVVLLGVYSAFMQQLSLLHRVPFDKPPDVLVDRVQSVRQSLGYKDDDVADRAYGFDVDNTYGSYVEKSRQGADRWRELTSGRDPYVYFWYRTSPRTLVPADLWDTVEDENPPYSSTGETRVLLDTSGRLLAFEAIPNQIAPKSAAPAGAAAPPINWDLLFTAANLPKSRFSQVTPEWAPHRYADTRAAWVGTLPELGDAPVRLEAAAYGGRITSFQTIFPWTKPATEHRQSRSWTEAITTGVYYVIELSLLLVSALIARHNWRMGRGNREGALRIALFSFIVELTAWFLRAKHVPFLEGETRRWFHAIGSVLYESGQLWLFYLALEPAVRRFWPDGLVSWNRLLAGQRRDPLVGWHLLCGVASGIALALALRVGAHVVEILEHGSGTPWNNPLFFMAGLRLYAGYVVSWIYDGLNTALFFVLIYAVARGSRATKGRNTLAVIITGIISVAAIAKGFVSGTNWPLELAWASLIVAVVLIAMLRFGLLAFVVMFFINNVLHAVPPTLNSSDWYAPISFATYGLIVGLAVYGFVLSRCGEPLFGRVLAEA